MSTETAIRFFYNNAGFSEPPGRQACAERLAAAEERYQSEGWDYEIVPDEDADEQPAYGVILHGPTGKPHGSLWGVDDPYANDYARVVAAELALEAFRDDEPGPTVEGYCVDNHCEICGEFEAECECEFLMSQYLSQYPALTPEQWAEAFPGGKPADGSYCDCGRGFGDRDREVGHCTYCGRDLPAPAGWDRAEAGPEQAEPERWGVEIVLLGLAYIAAPEGGELEDRLGRLLDHTIGEDGAEQLLSALPAVLDITPASVRQVLEAIAR